MLNVGLHDQLVALQERAWFMQVTVLESIHFLICIGPRP